MSVNILRGEPHIHLFFSIFSSPQSQGGGEVAQVPPKKTFLKRGEGLSRFTKTHNKPAFQKKEAKKDPKPRAHVISRSNSEPAAIRRGTTHRTQRLPVQRKTAILHKESRVRRSSSPPDLRAESTRAHLKGLGCHERQTSDGAESVQTETDGRRTKPLEQVTELSRSSQPNPVTKQLGVSGDIVTEDRGDVGSGGGRGEVPQDSFELSFQDKVQRWECDQQLENMELGEFELLEQAAEELSFSSNSSFVMKVLFYVKMQCHEFKIRPEASFKQLSCRFFSVRAGSSDGPAAQEAAGRLWSPPETSLVHPHQVPP